MITLVLSLSLSEGILLNFLFVVYSFFLSRTHQTNMWESHQLIPQFLQTVMVEWDEQYHTGTDLKFG